MHLLKKNSQTVTEKPTVNDNVTTWENVPTQTWENATEDGKNKKNVEEYKANPSNYLNSMIEMIRELGSSSIPSQYIDALNNAIQNNIISEEPKSFDDLSTEILDSLDANTFNALSDIYNSYKQSVTSNTPNNTAPVIFYNENNVSQEMTGGQLKAYLRKIGEKEEDIQKYYNFPENESGYRIGKNGAIYYPGDYDRIWNK